MVLMMKMMMKAYLLLLQTWWMTSSATSFIFFEPVASRTRDLPPDAINSRTLLLFIPPMLTTNIWIFLAFTNRASFSVAFSSCILPVTNKTATRNAFCRPPFLGEKAFFRSCVINEARKLFSNIWKCANIVWGYVLLFSWKTEEEKEKKLIIILFFVCLFMPPWASPLFTIFLHQHQKKKKKESLFGTYKY